jgi:DNA-directed RNA polymerase specialized sigma24 family protein
VSVRPDLDREANGRRALLRFAYAVVRDDRTVRDPWSSKNLADVLCKRALMAVQRTSAASRGPASTASTSDTVALFASFVHFHRRHVRQADRDGEEDRGLPLRQGEAPPRPIERAIRALPLEQREALLIVVLGGLSHQEAAIALDVPLAVLIGRLGLARRHVERDMRAESARVAVPVERGRHLRLIK